VTTIHVAAQSMTDDGFGEQLLCALFGFEPGSVRFVYNFKRGTFYPFVPQGTNTRDTERELQLQARLEGELPIEAELERGYTLWAGASTPWRRSTGPTSPCSRRWS